MARSPGERSSRTEFEVSTLAMTETNGTNRPDGQGALTGVRVLDLTHFVAGPAATMALAFMGAEVIKVERPDVESSQAPLNRLVINPNKKSITLDLKSKAGHDTVLRLARECDRFVE